MKTLIGKFGVVVALLMMVSVAQAGFAGAVEKYSQDYDGVTPPALPANWSQVWHSTNAETVNVAVGDNEQKLYGGWLYYTGREFGVPGSDAEKFTMEFDVVDLAGAGNSEMHTLIFADDEYPGPGGANQRAMLVNYNNYDIAGYRVNVQLWNIPGGSPEYYRETGPDPSYELDPGRWVIDVDGPNRLITLTAPMFGGTYTHTFDFTGYGAAVDPWFAGGHIGWAGTGDSGAHPSQYDNLYVEGVPEPATLAVLGIGGALALLGCRRKRA